MQQDYSQWYLDVIAAAEMVDNSPVKGCMVSAMIQYPMHTHLIADLLTYTHAHHIASISAQHASSQHIMY
jgi:hypothetical protein